MIASRANIIQFLRFSQPWPQQIRVEKQAHHSRVSRSLLRLEINSIRLPTFGATLVCSRKLYEKQAIRQPEFWERGGDPEKKDPDQRSEVPEISEDSESPESSNPAAPHLLHLNGSPQRVQRKGSSRAAAPTVGSFETSVVTPAVS